MRLDKLLSEMGIASRKDVKKAAAKGALLVDGVPVRDTSVHIDPERVTVTYFGKIIEYRKYTYVLLNKPDGYVSATEDKSLPCVTALLPEELQKMGLFPVGRLDKDTTGLMILTNNGALAHDLLSPRHHVEKEYRLTVDEPLALGVEDVFREGITLADGYECKSAVLFADPDRLGARIILTEGKYHQIKRMIAASGNKVTSLERIRFDTLILDPSLKRGEWRFLTASEIACLEAKGKN